MQIKIKNARLSFANHRKPFVPKTGEPKYTASFICGADTTIEVELDGKKQVLPHTAMGRVITKLATDKWKKMPARGLELFIYNRADASVGTRGPRVNEDGEFYDGYEADTFFFSAGTKVADAPDGILIVDQQRQKLPATSGHPVNGDYVNGIINAFAYEYEGKKGISASLEGIQYLRKGVPFGASKIDVNAFDEEELEDDAEEDDGSGLF